MGRLIDADALDDSFRDSIVKCKQWFEEASVLREEESMARAEHAYFTFMECSMRLKKQPTVDAVPVVHGEWICEELGDDVGVWCRWICSRCGEVMNRGWKNTRDGSKPKYDYCPNCGARMTKGENDEH